MIEQWELAVIADLTVDLTRLRQEQCLHLAVENCGPDIFYNLLMAYENTKPRVILDPQHMRPPPQGSQP